MYCTFYFPFSYCCEFFISRKQDVKTIPEMRLLREMSGNETETKLILLFVLVTENEKYCFVDF